MMKIMLKLLVVVLLSWLADTVLPPAPADLTAPMGELAASSDDDLAHGAYCQLPQEPTVFLGRDVPQLASYRAFRSWCTGRGGITRWSV